MIAGALHQITYLQALIISFVLADTGFAVVSLSVRASTLPLWTGHPRMRLRQEVVVSCEVAVGFQLAASLRMSIQTPVLEGGGRGLRSLLGPSSFRNVQPYTLLRNAARIRLSFL